MPKRKISTRISPLGKTPSRRRTKDSVEEKSEEILKKEDLLDVQVSGDKVAGEAQAVGIQEASKKPRSLKATAAAAAQARIAEAMKSSQPWTVLVHKKLDPEWFPYDPSKLRRPVVAEEGRQLFKVVSWNVNGLRALVKPKGKAGEEESLPLDLLVQKEDPDFICLQETKLQEKDVSAVRSGLLPKYKHSYWSCSTAKLGYSGCALFSKSKPLSVKYGLQIPAHDLEGRVITAEFEKFFLVTTYVPNAGDKLDRLGYREKEWDPALGKFVKHLEKTKPVILTGDMNVAFQEIDIYHPDGNIKSAGFTEEERQSFEQVFLKEGFVDTFRRQHPKCVGYTYWGYRTAARPKNAGWRLDYVLSSESLAEREFDSFIVPDIGGSDHCPVGLTIAL